MATVKYAEKFQQIIENHVGETATIYTCAARCRGFTGVILYVNNEYARLLIKAGPNPVRGIPGRSEANKKTLRTFDPPVSTIADIPLDKIACFVHNSI
ncbi:MAG: hypothetical protein BWY11_00805 [Firmicutes bacterium ADurb.Bin182]|nr:MAG: hypothetical protein BWY11_00805 [Firmicutes bacterium ADurb.Bin182]